ncbi:MAG: DUF2231 domain-containing protein [Verrucomicrobia bacterium]|nr:DUF2231 domain-containing protein [Verrucomicrobiota bacterium]
MTHFPIALLLFSTACDFAALGFGKRAMACDLHTVSFYSLIIAALASIGVVASGVALTAGRTWGQGPELWHHRFAWPAFGLVVALATWRLVVRDGMSPAGRCLYLGFMALGSALVAAAGYFGGEMLLGKG